MAVPQCSTGIAIGGAFTGTVINVTPPNTSREALDTSHMLTPSYRTYVPGKLIEGGEMTLLVQFDSAVTIPTLGALASTMITYPDGDVWTFDAFVMSMSPTADLDTVMQATVVLKVAGPIVIT